MVYPSSGLAPKPTTTNEFKRFLIHFMSTLKNNTTTDPSLTDKSTQPLENQSNPADNNDPLNQSQPNGQPQPPNPLTPETSANPVGTVNVDGEAFDAKAAMALIAKLSKEADEREVRIAELTAVKPAESVPNDVISVTQETADALFVEEEDVSKPLYGNLDRGKEFNLRPLLGKLTKLPKNKVIAVVRTTSKLPSGTLVEDVASRRIYITDPQDYDSFSKPNKDNGVSAFDGLSLDLVLVHKPVPEKKK